MTETQREAEMSPFFYSYLITDPEYYGSDEVTFQKNLTEVLQTHSVDILCFRDKITQEIKPLAQSCLETAKKFNIPKVLINGNIDLALELGFDGVHLTSTQFSLIPEAKKQNLFTLISCHSEDEIKLAKGYKANGVTYSPIFFKENKDTPKGCDLLVQMVQNYQEEDFLIIALGGITTKQRIEKVQETCCSGFASIGYFTNNNIL